MKLVHVLAASILLCSGVALYVASGASASTPSRSLSYCRDIAAAREATPNALPPAPSGAQLRAYLSEVGSLSATLRGAAAAALSANTRAELNATVTKSSTVDTDTKALLAVMDGPAPTSVAHRQKVATDLRTLDAADASFVAAFQSATALIGVCHGYAVVAGFAGSIAGASMSDKKPNDYVKGISQHRQDHRDFGGQELDRYVRALRRLRRVPHSASVGHGRDSVRGLRRLLIG